VVEGRRETLGPAFSAKQKQIHQQFFLPTSDCALSIQDRRVAMAERHKLLLESPQLQAESSPRRSAKSSSESEYVLSIAALPNFYAASVSSPSNVIDVFDKTTLQGIQTFPGHDIATTSLHTAENLGGVVQKCLISSGKDGSVKSWDDRSNSHSIKSAHLTLIFIDFGLSDNSLKVVRFCQ